MNYCTLIPSGRISEHARLELRLATDDASSVRVEVVRDSGQRTSQVFVLRSGREPTSGWTWRFLPTLLPTACGPKAVRS